MHAEENVFRNIRIRVHVATQYTASFLVASDTNLHRIRRAFPWKVNSARGLALLPGVTSNSRLNAASSPTPTDVDVSLSRTKRRPRFRMKFRSSSLRFRHPVPRAIPNPRLLQGTVKSPPGKSFARGQRVMDIFRPSTGRSTRHCTGTIERKRRDFPLLSTFALYLCCYYDEGNFLRCHNAFRWGTVWNWRVTRFRSRRNLNSDNMQLRWVVRCGFITDGIRRLLLRATLYFVTYTSPE